MHSCADFIISKTDSLNGAADECTVFESSNTELETEKVAAVAVDAQAAMVCGDLLKSYRVSRARGAASDQRYLGY